MLQIDDWDLASYWLVVRGDREFEPGAFPPSFDDARRLLLRLRDDDFASRKMRQLMDDEFGVHDLYRYNDDQVLDMLARQIAGGRLQIHRRPMERPASPADLPPNPPEQRKQVQAREETTWIEVVLVDEADRPVPGARYEIGRARGTPVGGGNLDGQGFARVGGIKPGSYQVGFPELDEELWCPSAPGLRAPREVASKHVVKQGECIESIAFEHGFFWETVWNLPENEKLRELRKSPNVLRPGDEVQIPVKRYEAATCQSGKRHVFRLKGVPSKLSIVVKVDDEVKANMPYVLFVDGKQYRGSTDGAGRLVHPIAPGARQGRLLIGQGDGQEELDLALGQVDPVEEISGLQARLNNLGLYCGEEDGDLDPVFEQAVMDFQAHHGLEPTGTIDAATRGKLREQHGG